MPRETRAGFSFCSGEGAGVPSFLFSHPSPTRGLDGGGPVGGLAPAAPGPGWGGCEASPGALPRLLPRDASQGTGRRRFVARCPRRSRILLLIVAVALFYLLSAAFLSLVGPELGMRPPVRPSTPGAVRRPALSTWPGAVQRGRLAESAAGSGVCGERC